MPTLDAVLLRAGGALGVRLVDSGPVSTGEQGARLVRSADDRAFVLKLTSTAPAVSSDVLSALRRHSVPVPRVAWEGWVEQVWASLQEFVEGSVPHTLSTAATAELLRLQEIQRGLCAEVAAPTPWSVRLRNDLTGAGDLAAQHGALHRHSPAGRSLVDVVARRAARADLDGLPGDDLVHGDLHHGNLLVDGEGRLAAVLDWDGRNPGDRRLDLVTLLFSARTVTSDTVLAGHLLPLLRCERSPEHLWLYGAHQTVRTLGWFALRHPEWDLPPWIASSAAVLDELGAG